MEVTLLGLGIAEVLVIAFIFGFLLLKVFRRTNTKSNSYIPQNISSLDAEILSKLRSVPSNAYVCTYCGCDRSKGRLAELREETVLNCKNGTGNTYEISEMLTPWGGRKAGRGYFLRYSFLIDGQRVADSELEYEDGNKRNERGVIHIVMKPIIEELRQGYINRDVKLSERRHENDKMRALRLDAVAESWKDVGLY